MPKISSLPTALVVNPSDYIVVVDNSSVPETKKALASLTGALAPVQSVAGKDGDVTLEPADIDGLPDLLGNTVYSVTDEAVGATQILNIVALTQEEYDAILEPQATTLYVIRNA